MTESKKIYESISAIMADISSVGKNRKNEQQRYQFRGVDDVYNELHSLMSKHKVFTTSEILSEATEERKTSKGGLLIYRKGTFRYYFHASDGSFVTTDVFGEGMDSGDKASNKAMSVAHKYALMQIFAIPTEEKKDPEDDNPDPTPKSCEQKNQENRQLQPTQAPQKDKPDRPETTEYGKKLAVKFAELCSVCTQEGEIYKLYGQAKSNFDKCGSKDEAEITDTRDAEAERIINERS